LHLTLQQLRLFEAVLRNASYTRAANELHLTQPAVSIQIKRLEEQVGLPLFEKVGKKMFPTPAGKAVYQTSLEILGKVDDLAVDIERMKGKVQGPLTLSVVTTTQYFLPHLLGQFLRQYPEVEPRLRFSNRARVVERLLDNEDDFVVMGRIPEDSQLESYPFLENILVPVAPPDHPLVMRKGIALDELVEERFLEREEGSGTRIAFDRLLKENGLQIEPYMELGSAEAIKQGVMSGLGLAVLSLHALRLECSSGKLAILDVQGFPIRRRWYAVHLKGKTLSLTAKTFLDFILEESSQVLGLENLPEFSMASDPQQ
jgi:DNA-binding transcriptional LysR family regulator